MNRPNVVWIFGDQHRAQAMGFNGDPNARTPNFDRWAETGCSFRNAVSGCPWCAPFRGALFTGLYNHLSVGRTPEALNPDLELITDPLNRAGYHTAYFGKWHLDGHNHMSFVPRERRGRFRTWLGYENNNAQYDCWIHGHDEHGREDTVAKAEKLEGYETDELSDRLIRFLEQDHPDPFFAVLSVQPPHDPHIAPPETMEKYRPEDIELRPNVPPVERIRADARKDLAGYYAQIENLDHNVGRILKALDQTGLSENTWVFYFSDHGDMHGSHGYVRKSSPWEESVCIPFLVRAPENREVKRISNVPLNHVDIAPTTLGICGLDMPESMQGTDWSQELLPGRPPPVHPPESAFLQHVFRKRFHCLNRTWRGVRTTDGWKYVCLEGQPFGLFNLNEDPFELNNLAFKDDHNQDRARLQSLLADWIGKTGDCFPLPEE